MILKKTKMVCTMGPATDKPGIIPELIKNGMDVARLNFSHGDHEEHAGRIARIKAARKELGICVAIMLDTKGPEIRTGVLKDGKVTLEEGSQIVLTTEDIEGDATRVGISYKGLPQDLSVGNKILIDDGLIELTVTALTDTEIACKVDNGGQLGSRKSANIPGVSINLPGLTEKDESDLIFGISQGIDFVAASFIRKPQDVIAIRKVLDNNGGGDVQIISKIENQEGVDKIDRILAVSDGIMVARGDLGVEIPAEDVPLVQKNIIRKCNLLGKPVITATQMLDSMIRNPRPTRAEVGDVANAVFDGTDAVMLSGETAAGDYPIEAVKTMCGIVEKIENSDEYMSRKKPEHGERTITNAVGEAVVQIVDSLNAAAIIAATSSGHTPRMLSKYRPECLIFGVSSKIKTVRRLCMSWGVYGLYTPELEDMDSMVMDMLKKMRELEAVKMGDLVVIAAGVPLGIQGNTNMIKVHTVGNAVLSGIGIGETPVTGFAKLTTPDTVNEFKEGDILVCRSLTPGIHGVLEKAAAIVTEENGDHMAAEEAGEVFGIPVVKAVSKATEIIENGKIISVDPVRGMIYQGKVRIR